MSRRLLELAQLKERTITIEGESVRIREPNGLQMMEYRALRKTDLPAAIAILIHECVLGEDGAKLYTLEEAKQIAGGHAKVFTPLIVALTGFDDTPEKKA